MKALLALALALPAVASAQDNPVQCVVPQASPNVVDLPGSFVANIVVGTQTLDLLPCLITDGKLSSLTAFFTTGLATGTISVSMNADPFVNFSVATTTLGAGPTFFQLTFGTFVVPTQYDAATSSLSGSLTNGVGTATVTNAGATPFLVGNGTLAGLPALPNVPGNLGVDVGSGPCTVGPAAGSTTCPSVPANAANSFAPTTFDGLRATLTYNQSGQLSQASFTGRVDIFPATTVPEPGTVALLATGLALVAGVGAARRKRA